MIYFDLQNAKLLNRHEIKTRKKLIKNKYFGKNEINFISNGSLNGKQKIASNFFFLRLQIEMSAQKLVLML